MTIPEDPRLEEEIQKHPFPLLFVTVSGAHLYGFPSKDSDFDLRGVHILPTDEVLGLEDPKETIERSGDRDGLEMDLVTHDVKKFMGLMLKKNGYVLEQLYSPLVLRTSSAHEELKALGRDCITRHHSHHYLGFARSEWDLFLKGDPPKVKRLLYVYRVLLTGIDLMETGVVEANLVTLNDRFQLPYIPDLIEQKTGGTEKGGLKNADLEFYRSEFERLVAKLEEARDRSDLPEKPGAKPAMSDLLVRIRKEMGGRGD